MIGRRHYNRVESVLLEQLLHVGEYVGNTESLRERARLYAIVVADGNQRCAFDFREDRKVGELSDCAGAYQRNSAVGRGRPVCYFDRLTATGSSGPP